MKKQIITIGLIAVLASSHNAHCTPIYCSEDMGGNTTDCPYCTIITNIINCGDIQYCNCFACKNNATPTTRTIQTGKNQYTEISECPKTIDGGEIIGSTCPTECPNTTWTNVSGTNYQTRCDSNLFNPQCEYQCQSGYYGTDNSCNKCPPVDNSLSTKQYGTSDAGATTITNCYLTPGTYYDHTGTFTISGGNCQYQN